MITITSIRIKKLSEKKIKGKQIYGEAHCSKIRKKVKFWEEVGLFVSHAKINLVFGGKNSNGVGPKESGNNFLKIVNFIEDLGKLLMNSLHEGHASVSLAMGG